MKETGSDAASAIPEHAPIAGPRQTMFTPSAKIASEATDKSLATSSLRMQAGELAADSKSDATPTQSGQNT